MSRVRAPSVTPLSSLPRRGLKPDRPGPGLAACRPWRGGFELPGNNGLRQRSGRSLSCEEKIFTGAGLQGRSITRTTLSDPPASATMPRRLMILRIKRLDRNPQDKQDDAIYRLPAGRWANEFAPTSSPACRQAGPTAGLRMIRDRHAAPTPIRRRDRGVDLYRRCRRSELSTTEIELSAMVREAIMGFSLPTAAIGMARVL